MDKPYFSVIVPAHNSEAFIEKGLHSIKMQTFTDYELIVVCDNCTDRTAEIALGYADKTLIRNYGLDGLARNAGIEAAEGEWLLFMDDDDWWLHPYVFEMLAGRVGRMDEDIMTFGFLAKDFQKEGLQEYENGPERIWPAVWNKCWKREFIGDTRFPGIEFTSDMPFSQDVFRKGPKVCNWRVPMYFYNYMRKGSQTERHSRGG